jgi:thiol:disulfide interchange protein
MTTRALASIAALLALFVMPLSAVAADAVKFDATAFAEAKKAGKSVLVDVHAPWCSTCKAQKAVLAELTAKPEYKDIVVFDIDFDTQKDDWKALRVQSRSTLIGFKGETETGRSVADTKKETIEALLKSTL